MLVLSRKPGEQIRIGDEITLTIVKMQGKTVRVGIEAPKDIRIVRGELPPLSHRVAPARDRVLRVTSDVPRDVPAETGKTSPATRVTPRDPNCWSVTSMRDRVRPTASAPRPAMASHGHK